MKLLNRIRRLIDRFLPSEPTEEEGDDQIVSVQRIKLYPICCANCGTPLEDGDLVAIWKSGAITHCVPGEEPEQPRNPSHVN